MSKKAISTGERFDRFVLRGPDCWEWQGARNGNGYGYFGISTGKTVKAHRFAYERAHGPIPSDMAVHLRCANSSCVNPAHLFLAPLNTAKPVDERFWSKVSRSDSCWTWTAHCDHHGYGTVTISGRQVLAHRAAWELTFGEIPSGLLVLHSCDNPPCVNPAHLRLGTHRDNTWDAISRGRSGLRSQLHRDHTTAVEL